jgi:hypothetical protein
VIYWIKKYFTDRSAHLVAAYEVIATALFSLAPFFITYFVESAKREDNSFIHMSAIVGRGQLYLLSYALYGTVFWLAFMKSDRPRHGARAFLGIVSTLIMIPVIGFLGVDPTFSTVLNENIVYLSYWFYGILLVINYLLLFYFWARSRGHARPIRGHDSSWLNFYSDITKSLKMWELSTDARFSPKIYLKFVNLISGKSRKIME